MLTAEFLIIVGLVSFFIFHSNYPHPSPLPEGEGVASNFMKANILVDVPSPFRRGLGRGSFKDLQNPMPQQHLYPTHFFHML